MGVETLPNALGSKAYVHLVALGTEDAVNEGCVHAGERLCEGIRCSGHCGVQDAFSFRIRTGFAVRVGTFMGTRLDGLYVSGSGLTWRGGRAAFTKVLERMGFLR